MPTRPTIVASWTSACAVQTVAYRSGGVQYRREYFASRPANVIVLRFMADKPGAYNGTIALTDMHNGKIAAENGEIGATASMKGYRYGGGEGAGYRIALRGESRIAVVHQGGDNSGLRQQQSICKTSINSRFISTPAPILCKTARSSGAVSRPTRRLSLGWPPLKKRPAKNFYPIMRPTTNGCSTA